MISKKIFIALIGSLFVFTILPINHIYAQSAMEQSTYFKAEHSDKCLDVNNSGSQNGNKVQQWSCNGTNAQNWIIEYVGSGPSFRGQAGNYYQLRNRASNKCLDVEGFASHNGARVTQWDCNRGTNQQWLLYNHFWAWSPKVTLYNKHSGKCLDVSGSSKKDGVEMMIWDCNGGKNQNWYWNGN